MAKSLRQFGLLIGLRGCGALATILLNVLLIAHVDAATAGIFMTITSWGIIASMLPLMNIDAGIPKFYRLYIETRKLEELGAYLYFLNRMLLVNSALLITIGIAILAIYFGNYFWPYLCILLSIPMLASMRLRSQIASSQDAYFSASFARSFVRPISLLIIIYLMIVFEQDLNLHSLSLAFILSMTLAWFTQNIALSRLAIYKRVTRVVQKEWVVDGFSLGMNMVLIEFLVEITIAVSAFFLIPADIAVFSLALRIFAFGRFAVATIDQLQRTNLSRAIIKGELELASAFLRQSAMFRLGFAAISAVLIMGILISGFQPIAHEQFTQICAILSLELLVLIIFGSPHYVLIQVLNSKQFLHIMSLSLLIYVIVLAIGSFFFGITGAALASSFALCLRSLIMFAIMIHKTDLNTTLVSSKRSRLLA